VRRVERNRFKVGKAAAANKRAAIDSEERLELPVAKGRETKAAQLGAREEVAAEPVG
jgi:hypothetical protein